MFIEPMTALSAVEKNKNTCYAYSDEQLAEIGTAHD